jgi:hypothetical protein
MPIPAVVVPDLGQAPPPQGPAEAAQQLVDAVQGAPATPETMQRATAAFNQYLRDFTISHDYTDELAEVTFTFEVPTYVATAATNTVAVQGTFYGQITNTTNGTATTMSTKNWPEKWLVSNTCTHNDWGVTTVTYSARVEAQTWNRWNDTYENMMQIRNRLRREAHVNAQPRVPVAPHRQPMNEAYRQRLLEEERRRQGLAEERQRQWDAQQAAAKAAREKAQGKAISLLLSALTEEQRKDLLTHDYFFVKSQMGNLYRIDRGSHLNVRLIDPHTRKVIRTYCAYASNGAPDGDSMLAQKLMLECMEEEFLKIANVHQHEPPPHQNIGREDFVRLVGAGPLAGVVAPGQA